MSFLDFFRRARKRSTVIDGATVEFEPGFREFARVTYCEANRSLDLDGEWLGWGKGQKSYLLILLEKDIPAHEAELIAGRLSRALDKLKVPNVIEQWEERVPILPEECERGLAEYADWMRTMGREITYDKADRTMRESKIPGSDNRLAEYIRTSPVEYTRRFNEAMSFFRGFRSPTRPLAKSAGVEHLK